MTDQAISFAGFKSPDKNYSELPHEFILLLPLFKSLAELKIVLYILRHTWGFHEYDEPKQITTDEFEHGRKNRKGKRIDSGVGMVKNSILDGLQRAVEHGFIEVETDNSDKARIGKSYMLRMFKSCTSEGQTLNPGIPEVEPRTEKPTLEINQESKEIPLPSASLSADPKPENNLVEIEPLSTIQVRGSGSLSTIIPDSAIVFTGALEPTPKVAEKGSSLPNGQYVPPAGFEQCYVSRQIDQESRTYTEHLIIAGTNDPFPKCKRCGLVLSDGSRSQTPAMNTVYVRCLGDEPKKARASPKEPAEHDPLFDWCARYLIGNAPAAVYVDKELIGWCWKLVSKIVTAEKRLIGAKSLNMQARKAAEGKLPGFLWYFSVQCKGCSLSDTKKFAKWINKWYEAGCPQSNQPEPDSGNYVSEIDTTKGKLYAVPAK